jgi:ketosteroid isomerase-like protein
MYRPKKYIFSFAIIFLAVWLTSISAFSQSNKEFEAEVKRAVAEYDNAWNKKDVKTVSNFLADDYVYFTSTGGTTDRKSTIEFLSSPDYKLTFVERSEIVVHTKGGTAVVSSRWKGRGTWKNEEIDDDQRCGQVFVKEKKAWKMLTEHCVQIISK